MTPYTVVWDNRALEELTTLWITAEDRTRITESASEIDQILSKDAVQRGDEIREGLMELVVEPLRVIFSVRESDRIVEIYKVVVN